MHVYGSEAHIRQGIAGGVRAARLRDLLLHVVDREAGGVHVGLGVSSLPSNVR